MRQSIGGTWLFCNINPEYRFVVYMYSSLIAVTSLVLIPLVFHD